MRSPTRVTCGDVLELNPGVEFFEYRRSLFLAGKPLPEIDYDQNTRSLFPSAEETSEGDEESSADGASGAGSGSRAQTYIPGTIRVPLPLPTPAPAVTRPSPSPISNLGKLNTLLSRSGGIESEMAWRAGVHRAFEHLDSRQVLATPLSLPLVVSRN